MHAMTRVVGCRAQGLRTEWFVWNYARAWRHTLSYENERRLKVPSALEHSPHRLRTR